MNLIFVRLLKHQLLLTNCSYNYTHDLILPINNLHALSSFINLIQDDALFKIYWISYDSSNNSFDNNCQTRKDKLSEKLSINNFNNKIIKNIDIENIESSFKITSITESQSSSLTLNPLNVHGEYYKLINERFIHNSKLLLP